MANDGFEGLAAGQVGVFIYGSLIGDPGPELEAATIGRIENADTPLGGKSATLTRDESERVEAIYGDIFSPETI